MTAIVGRFASLACCADVSIVGLQLIAIDLWLIVGDIMITFDSQHCCNASSCSNSNERGEFESGNGNDVIFCFISAHEHGQVGYHVHNHIHILNHTASISTSTSTSSFPHFRFVFRLAFGFEAALRFRRDECSSEGSAGSAATAKSMRSESMTAA